MCATAQHDIQDSVSPIRALHGLSEAQTVHITTGLPDLPDWSVEHHDSCDGHLFLLFSDHSDTTLIIDRDSAGFQISQMQGDVLHPGECRYSSADEVIAALEAMTKTDNTGSYGALPGQAADTARSACIRSAGAGAPSSTSWADWRII